MIFYHGIGWNWQYHCLRLSFVFLDSVYNLRFSGCASGSRISEPVRYHLSFWLMRAVFPRGIKVAAIIYRVIGVCVSNLCLIYRGVTQKEEVVIRRESGDSRGIESEEHSGCSNYGHFLCREIADSELK